ncbi:MAG: hypothetical protein IJ733_01545 [Lachnospiraceae bacterium]|nr:hypothetical protein [Lachnospiraceae bacterium]
MCYSSVFLEEVGEYFTGEAKKCRELCDAVWQFHYDGLIRENQDVERMEEFYRKREHEICRKNRILHKVADFYANRAGKEEPTWEEKAVVEKMIVKYKSVKDVV